MRSLRVFVFIAAAGVLFSVQSAKAQNSNGEESITLSPAVSRPELKAGDSATGKLQVINNGTTSYTFVLYARPFSVQGEQYDPNYTEVNERTEAYQWVTFEKTKFDLKAGERVEVNYDVTVPERAKAGGHYAVLFAETQPTDDGSSVARKKRVGSLLYMTVDGDIIREGSLESWDTTFLQTKEPVLSTVRIKNSGNVHFQADLKAQYTNIFGKKQFELNQEMLVMPGTTRRAPVAWESAPYFGIFKASGTVTYLDKTEVLEAKWIILLPKSLISIILATLSALIVLTLYNKKRRTKGKSKAPASEKEKTK